jgi:hypothetical protein
MPSAFKGKESYKYPNWEKDYDELREYQRTERLKSARNQAAFMHRKQSIFVGDRSHPRLVLLDSIEFTYPGWKKDKASAEKYHVFHDDNHVRRVSIRGTLFEQQFYRMKERQERWRESGCKDDF